MGSLEPAAIRLTLEHLQLGVSQTVRMFSPCQFQVYVSIGTLESDLCIISKYPLWSQMDISLFIKIECMLIWI